MLCACAESLLRMSKKRPLAPPASPTDEWGIYDPAKAGMQALYSRLGRPILRASDASQRRDRRRANRPERSADGVGLAIQEAKRRAGLMEAPPLVPPPPSVAPPPVAEPIPEPAARVARAGRGKVKATAKRKPPVVVEDVRAVAPPPTPAVTAPAPEPPIAAAPVKGRGGRKGRTRQMAAVDPPAIVAAPVAVPPPSPRRPRGPVPLAAWAHAVNDAERPEPKRSEAKGLWRGIFRIPSEVALVEYGRGCRIHRVVIETAADALVDAF